MYFISVLSKYNVSLWYKYLSHAGEEASWSLIIEL